jgi:glyoxylase-like metal-dependent hydrolase (beta-lactamase superfamily II)
VIVERVEHQTWTSNAYLVADRPGGTGVLCDSNGLESELIDHARRDGITITHVLVTHQHSDHVVDVHEHAKALGVPLVASRETADAIGGVGEVVADGDVIRSGALAIRALATPGHCPGHLAFLAGDSDCLTADCLFRGTVAGTLGGGETGFADLRHSIMDVLLALPPATRLHPGHTLPTTVAEELESNPFVRIWRGLDDEGSTTCTVRGEPATLVLWAPDYDGTNKAWVRFRGGRDAIVGGSQVTR